MSLCYIDTETTGLDPRIHQPYEVCIWPEAWSKPFTYGLPHTLEYANTTGLKISHYFERGFVPWDEESNRTRGILLRNLNGVTLVGSNPSFDANMMQKYLGVAVWHHRFIDVSNVAMMVFDWDVPKGLFDVAGHLSVLGWEIPEPDHTAEGDVRVTRAVYEALRTIRRESLPPRREGKP